MKKRILRYLKHIGITALLLIIFGFMAIVNMGGSLHYSDNPKMHDIAGNAPYVFYENDSTVKVQYIRGNKTDGFYTEQKMYPTTASIPANCYFPLDSSRFYFDIQSSKIEAPKAIYQDEQPILAISDIESGYKTFRDFLIQNKVINKQLDWIFGKGHLVLVGDFVDRGNSTMQVLWFIYKLEQAAKEQGGTVHFILGNHELKNMQGKYKSAAPKYYGIAAILGKQLNDLYSSESFIGRWMASKNTMEWINGNLFVHGGIHPDVNELDVDINTINAINKKYYYHAAYPKNNEKEEQILTSHRTGITWYRGYFKADLQTEQIEKTLEKFNANSIIVGHTLQSKVNRLFDGKVIAIDVKHPKDYEKNFPVGESEGLLIENGNYFRILANGERVGV